jgi:hypothetical protein
MDMEIRVIQAKDGTDIWEICSDGKVYRMNSLYRPAVEAKKYAQQFEGLEKGSVLIVFGYGNGIFPEAIADACKDKVTLLFYEPGLEIAECIDSQMSLEKWVRKKGVYFISPKSFHGSRIYKKEEFPVLLEQIITYSNRQKVQFCALPQYRDIFPEEYKHFAEQIQYRLKKLQTNIATAKFMGQEAVVNNIMNLQYVPNSYCGDSFRGIFPKDMPAIIVSAGPSLEKNVHFLQQAKNRALIVCVDSAAKYLLNQNITPDFMVSVDSKKPLSLFEDASLEMIPLVGSVDMNYRILELVNSSKIIFASTENTYVQHLYEKSGHSIHRLKSGGSVATLAFSLCVYWGMQRVILVGQDLAFTGEQMYAGREGVPEEEVNGTHIQVEDIYGNMLWTNPQMHTYLKWFEQEIALYPGVEVIDATEGGAKIEGTQIMSLREALESCAKQEYNIGELLESVSPAFDEEQKQEIAADLKESAGTLGELTRQLERGIGLARQGCELVQQKVADMRQLMSIESEIQSICEYYDSLEESFFIQRQIDATELETYLALFQQEQGLSKKEQYDRLEAYFECLLRAVRRVGTIWDDLMHRK